MSSRFQIKPLLFFALLILLLLASFIAHLNVQIPSSQPIRHLFTTEFYSADGTKFYELYHRGTRTYTELHEISPYLREAMIAVEDRHFYYHFGLNPYRILKAFIENILAKEKRYGASTITQQLARNLYLSLEKTWRRKLQEAYYTLLLEANFSKDDILEGYLNTIYFGHGIYGVGDAARFYFNKQAKDLTLKEAAMLTAIIRAPQFYSPLLKPEANEQRANMILRLMRDQKRITPAEYEQALKETVALYGKRTVHHNPAPYFLDVVQQELAELELKPPHPLQRGQKVYTTLDLRLNHIIEEGLDHIFPSWSPIEAALYAIEPNTGYVRAIVGGRDYSASQFNRATQSVRQTGSTIKPLLYYRALEAGFTPSTRLKSEPTTFYLHHEPFTPQNYNRKYLNRKISLAYALATSDNIYAVKTHLFLGDEAMIDTLRTFGITTPIEAHPALSLGINEMKLSELVTAYAYLASYGKQVIPKTVTKVTTLDDVVLFERQKDVGKQVLDPHLSFILSDLLTGMFDRKMSDAASSAIRVTGYSLSYELNGRFSGKSGLTDFDSWMIGYNPKLVLGIWTGYDSHTPLVTPSETGYAKRLWGYVMRHYFQTPEPFFRPTAKVRPFLVDPITGEPATPHTPYAKPLYYKIGMEPFFE